MHNNKPVAWIEPDVIPLTYIIKAVVRREQDEQYSIPLYTNPVKEQELLDEIAQLKHINRNWQISENILLLELEKLQMRELTDEEIEECYWGDGYPDNPRHPKEFARAILRKAQEK